MPARSKAQLRAMYASASGHSTLGIPTSVGKEYVAATEQAKNLPERKKPPKPSKKHSQKANVRQGQDLVSQMRGHLTKSGRVVRGG